MYTYDYALCCSKSIHKVLYYNTIVTVTNNKGENLKMIYRHIVTFRTTALGTRRQTGHTILSARAGF